MITFDPYEKKAQYYETDSMGIIHHSNYIRWFEEARVDLMEKMGMGYDLMEQDGIVSPVLGVTCEYKSPVKFGDVVLITCMIKAYNGVKMLVEYSITDKKTGEIKCVGKTEHCFLNIQGRPISLKRNFKEFDEIFKGYISDGCETEK